jgi:hypothetical protein
MRFVLSVIIFFSYFIAPLEVRSASCSDRALNCVVRWGAPHNACYQSFRLAACEKTGKYVAPNGNIWPASQRVSQLRGDR